MANLKSTVSGHCTTLSEHVISIRTSYFDIDFASYIKLTKFPPLIHWFVRLHPGFVFRESRPFSPQDVTSSCVFLNGGFPYVSQTFSNRFQNNVDLPLELFVCFYF